MKIRYKKSGLEGNAFCFNASAINEVLTGDDSSFISDLDVWLDKKREWKDMKEAFENHDLITDNHNICFFEPNTREDQERGYTL